MVLDIAGIDADATADRETAKERHRLETARTIPGLDALRAFSVVLVIIGHGSYVPGGEGLKTFDRLFTPSGFGVGIFFVISGYLITTILLKAKRIDLADFYRRRAFRILPAAFVYLAAVAAFVPVRDLGYAVLFARNLEPGLGSSFTHHYWSLAVEEQFYLLWPTFLILIPRRFVVPLLGAWLLVLPVWMHFMYFGNSLRGDLQGGPITIGCLLAFIRWRPTARIGTGLVVGGLLSAEGAPFVLHGHGSFIFLIYATMVGQGAIVYGASAGGLGFLDCVPLRWIGRLSYSLYLWQQLWTCVYSIRPWTIGHWPWCLAPLAACGILSYYLVEQPMLRLRDSVRAPVST